MQAGRLRHRITISRATKTQNASGEDVITWSSLGTFWAEILPLTGREFEHYRQLWPEGGHRVAIRFQQSITFRREDRITWGSRTLDIQDIRQIEGKRIEMQFICRELVT